MQRVERNLVYTRWNRSAFQVPLNRNFLFVHRECLKKNQTTQDINLVLIFPIIFIFLKTSRKASCQQQEENVCRLLACLNHRHFQDQCEGLAAMSTTHFFMRIKHTQKCVCIRISLYLNTSPHVSNPHVCESSMNSRRHRRVTFFWRFTESSYNTHILIQQTVDGLGWKPPK